MEHRNTFRSTSGVENEFEELQAHGSLWENVCGCLSVLKILLTLLNIQKTSWGKKKKNTAVLEPQRVWDWTKESRYLRQTGIVSGWDSLSFCCLKLLISTRTEKCLQSVFFFHETQTALFHGNRAWVGSKSCTLSFSYFGQNKSVHKRKIVCF